MTEPDIGPWSGETVSEAEARERLYMERIRSLDSELAGSQEEIAKLREEIDALRLQIKQLSYQRAVDARTIRRHEVKIDRLRLDKQLTRFPRWIATRLSGKSGRVAKQEETQADRGHLLVLAPKYPTQFSPYGGQPIERRVLLYAKSGYKATVFVPSQTEQSEEIRRGVKVIRSPLSSMSELVGSSTPSHLLVHHPVPELWNAVRPFIGKIPIMLWIHGFEARDWRQTHYNFSEQEIEEKRAWLDALNVDRRLALKEAFADNRVKKIFVSEYMRGVAEEFVKTKAVNATIIHNVIDTDLFKYRRRQPEERLRILSVRSFAARNYATDLVRRTIEVLATKPWAENLQIEIRGDGKHFQEDTESIEGLPNVSVTRGIVDGYEMAELMDANGVMLLPTRLDSQGMTMGEAMSTGMVVVTNRVSAIPEFADEQTAMLADPDDVDGMVDAILQLYTDPELYLNVSEAAARRVRAQCGPDATVAKEVALFDSLASSRSREKLRKTPPEIYPAQ